MIDEIIGSAGKFFSRWNSMDINSWYSHYNGICPNCGTDMRMFHPSMNIYPHFTGMCVEFKKKEEGK